MQFHNMCCSEYLWILFYKSKPVFFVNVYNILDISTRLFEFFMLEQFCCMAMVYDLRHALIEKD